MKTKLITLTILIFSAGSDLQAQNVKFIKDGIIEYEKTINTYTVFPRFLPGPSNQQQRDRYRSEQPQFLILKSTLAFSKDKTFFQPAPNPTGTNYFSGFPGVGQHNIIYTDLAAHTSISQRDVLGDAILLSDKSRSIKWKITDETREIAGFLCRRANALILDSVYVVAFYTSNIAVPGGPESFTGLPGMILQVSLPHDNITWVATKVTEQTVPVIKPPAKGKQVNSQELRNAIEPVIQRYGPEKLQYLKGLLL